MIKKVAIYCRVSTDEQKKKQTIENQIEMLREYVEFKKDEFQIYDEYLDDGTTGTMILNERNGGKRLIEDAKVGLFETVIVWRVDRFGRDTLSGLQGAQLLIDLDIKIVSMTEPFDLNTPVGRYQFISYLNMAELDRNNILDRMFIGATRHAKMGKWLGGIVPFGYYINADGYLQISTNKMDCGYSEEEVIKMIYNLYTNGKSAVDIALHLNGLNIPSSYAEGKCKRKKSTSSLWSNASILRILNSTTYKGIHQYGKRATRRKEIIVRQVPAIVSEELWEKARFERERKKVSSRRNLKGEKFLLRGMIECGKCHRKYYGVSYKTKNDFYVCSGKRHEVKKLYGKTCDNPNIAVNMIENEVWNDCLHIIKNYSEHITRFRQSSVDNSLEMDLSNTKKSLEKLKKGKNNILSLYRKELITEEELKPQLMELKKEEDVLNALLLSHKERSNILNHKNELANSLEDKLKYYNERINNLTFDDKKNILNLLVKKVTINTEYVENIEVPKIDVVYSIVKLDLCTDTDSYYPLIKNLMDILHCH